MIGLLLILEVDFVQIILPVLDAMRVVGFFFSVSVLVNNFCLCGFHDRTGRRVEGLPFFLEISLVF
mgnify:CR=1 FL=1